jgi:hypothetical protein
MRRSATARSMSRRYDHYKYVYLDLKKTHLNTLHNHGSHSSLRLACVLLLTMVFFCLLLLTIRITWYHLTVQGRASSSHTRFWIYWKVYSPTTLRSGLQLLMPYDTRTLTMSSTKTGRSLGSKSTHHHLPQSWLRRHSYPLHRAEVYEVVSTALVVRAVTCIAVSKERGTWKRVSAMEKNTLGCVPVVQ